MSLTITPAALASSMAKLRQTMEETSDPALAAIIGRAGLLAIECVLAGAVAGAPHSTGKWTPERLTLLRAEFPTCTDREALLARINALPGDPVASVDSLRKSAYFFDISATAEAVQTLRSNGGAIGGRRTQGLKRLPSRQPKVRTPERVAAFPALWLDPHLTVCMIQARLNTLPGEPIKAGQQLYGWAIKAGLPTQRPMPEDAQPEPAPAATQAAPEPAPAAPPARPAAPAPRDDKADAFEAFDAGVTVRGYEAESGLPLGTIATWHAEWKRRSSQERAA